MSHSVDLWTTGQISLSKGKTATHWVSWKDDVAQEHWYRIAPSLPKGYRWQAGWRLEIVSEGMFVDENGLNKAYIKIKNTSGDDVADEGAIVFVLTIMASPSHHQGGV
jgi:hypothetical protein